MKNQNFVQRFNLLKEMQESCSSVTSMTEEDSILLYYTECLIKLYKAYDKICKTDMLIYVKQIVAPAFPLVVDYFCKTAKFWQADKINRYDILKDIEISVVEFCEMLEVIVNSTNGADRILLQTAPVDTGVRHIPIKLCSYYSSMLNDCVSIFGENYDGQYAFSVYPSLKSGSEAHIMFSKVPERGRVCIIQIPEQSIAYISFVRQVLFHELFHILPEEVRLRYRRGDAFSRVLLSELAHRFTENQEILDEKGKIKLQEYLFEPLANDNRKYLKKIKDYDDINVHSEKIQKYFADEAVNCVVQLQNIRFGDLAKYLEPDKKWKDYEEYNKWHEGVKGIWSSILLISQEIINNREIEYLSDFFMTLFREPLSDLLTVVMLRLSPKLFFQQLLQAQGRQFGEAKFEHEDILYFRAKFVVDVLESEKIQEELNKDEPEIALLWKNAKDEFEKVIKIQEEEDEKKIESICCPQKIELGEVIQNLYRDYFVDCCRDFLRHVSPQKEKLNVFRDRYDLNYANDEELIMGIVKRSWEE